MKDRHLFNQATVIKLGIKDLQDCLALDNLILNGIWTRSQWEKELTNTNGIRIGIAKSKQLIGFACGSLVLDELNINIIGIHPLYQKNGLGSLALNSLLCQAIQLGSTIATLEVKESNEMALALYRKLNFEVAGHRDKYYKDGSKAIILLKNLHNWNKNNSNFALDMKS